MSHRLTGAAVMSEDAVRRTRSQKRALERDSLSSPTTSPTAAAPEAEGKRARLEDAMESAGQEEWAERAERAERATRPRVEPVGRTSTLLSGAEVSATIKVEVQTGEEPMDMSATPKSEIKKEKRPPTPDDDDDDDDVIVLSDNESPSPQMNGHFKELDTDLLMKSSPEERERIIKQLKQELRLEEAKLVLLKRLRQSQMQKDSLPKAVGSGSVATPPPLVRGSFTAAKGSQQVLSGRSSGTVIPPPLVRGGQQLSKHGSQNSQVIMPPLVRGAPPISVSPQQLQSLRQQHHHHHHHHQQQHQHQHHQHHQQQHSGSAPPPLMLAPRASVPGAQGHKLLQAGGLIRVANVPTTSMLVNISQSSPTNMKSSLSSQSAGGIIAGNHADSPASRQAAAKLALRKQLEKTLLEIPPPKPPAPEFNFLPSAANNEFIYLVGLEEVVQNLLGSGRAKQGLPVAVASASTSASTSSRDPLTCSQCHTDFTCRWRRDKGGATLCEHCMASNQKRALKAEHTNRLKAAFVKALQQEQEIEQRILQQAAAAASSSAQTSSSSSSSSASNAMHLIKADQLVAQQMKQRSSLQQHQISRANTNIGRHHATIKQSQGSGQLSRSGVQSSGVGVRGVTHSFSHSSQLQSAVAAAALVARPGKPASARTNAGGRSHGSHGNAAVWRKPSSVTSGVTMAYVNPSLSVHKTSSSSSAVERQREYLLDMLPSRTLSQTANTWK